MAPKTLKCCLINFQVSRTCFRWLVPGVIVVLLVESATGVPSPIMSRVNPDEPGVYSLFPNENLRTGKNLNPPHDSDPDRYRGREREHDRDHFSAARHSRHFDNFDYRLRNSDSQHSNRILFDDERLNYPSRPRPHFRPEYHERPPVPIYSQEFSGRIIPAFPESKLPPARSGEEEARIHVFNPDSNSFGRPGLPPRIIPLIEPKRNHHAFPPADVDIQPGRILIPGHNSIMNLRDPGPDSFLNHDEYLDYHTKAAIDAQQVLDKKDRKTDARKLLFSSANIAGLVPPKFDGEDDEENSSEPTPQIRLSHRNRPQTVTLPPEEEVTVTVGSTPSPQARRLQNRPVLENGFVPIRPFRVNKGEEESPRLRDVKAGKLQLRPETTSSRPTTTNKPPPVTFSPTYSYPYVKKSSPITRIIVTKAPPLLIPAAAETFLPFTEVVDTDELGPTRFRTEIPLIFLETQEKIVGGLPKGKKMVVVKRLKANIRESISVGSPKNTTPSSIESTMRIHKSEVDSGEACKDGLSSTEFNLQQSSSATGVVSKIHAHVSNCPKLHGPAEIICDVHIRKRHGSPNPQLSVGWKRKFHNGTTPDLVLAVNKTLAYIEEEFHDKFNVTLAPGISPMLRSVLSIRHVSPTDTGNYQCEVNDGDNKLRSDTLLFLCH